MDRTNRPDDGRAPPADGAGDDGPAGNGIPDEREDGAPDASNAPDEDDRSVLHVASEGTNWRFSLDDLDDDGEPVEPLTPGTPEPEHVAFVLMGAALTLFVFSRFFV